LLLQLQNPRNDDDNGDEKEDDDANADNDDDYQYGDRKHGDRRADAGTLTDRRWTRGSVTSLYLTFELAARN